MITVWVITLNNAIYPIGFGGGIPGYLTKKSAEDDAREINKHSKEYIMCRGGKLSVQPITAEKFVLESLRVFTVEE